MESLVHADIFFFIATICLVVVTIGWIVIIVYLVKLLRGLNGIVNEAHAGLAMFSNFLESQLNNSQSKIGAMVLIAEGLIRLFGRATSSKNYAGEDISRKKK